MPQVKPRAVRRSKLKAVFIFWFRKSVKRLGSLFFNLIPGSSHVRCTGFSPNVSLFVMEREENTQKGREFGFGREE